MTGFAPAQGRRPTIEWIPLDELRIDDAYQRSIDTAASRRQIHTIAFGWNWDLCMVLSVSRRPDDALYVVDGQHRLAAARLRGDIDAMPCCVVRRAGGHEEARLFIAANRTRRTVNVLDDFHAAVAAGDEEALTIARLVQAAGLRVARHKNSKSYGPGELGYVIGLTNALRRHGAPVLGAALSTIGEAFPDEVLVNPGAMLGAIVAIHAHPPEGFDPEAFFAVLLSRTTEEWGRWSGLTEIRGGKARAYALRGSILTSFATRALAA